MAGVPAKRLRHYDAIGLFKPAWVDPTNDYRYYSAAQLAQLNRILALKDLDVSLVMPGHGQPFSDLSIIDNTQAYLRDVWARVGEAHTRGRTAEQAAAEVDMTDHADAWPQIQEVGVPIATVVRIYELLDGEN